MYDTVIIGAGMSGLAAGIRLAYFDRPVCILERHTTIGGLNSFYRRDGRNYDVGLHAVTNFSPRGAKRGPLAKLLRQLRLDWDELSLTPQSHSAIAFPQARLRFSNNIEMLQDEIRQFFPRSRDGFVKLLAEIRDYDQLETVPQGLTARQVLDETIPDPLLREMLLAPLCYYGSASENDMEFAQFCIMFRSIYLEGFARPRAGVRLILKTLVRRFRELGGQLRLRTGVQHLDVADGKVQRVILENGEEIVANQILSSAGWLETLRMCGNTLPEEPPASGQLSFVEGIHALTKQPKDLGMNETIVFFNDSNRFHWERPQKTPVDLRSGVVCTPNNYEYDEPLAEGMIRLTALADYAPWKSWPTEVYSAAKEEWQAKLAESVIRFVPDFRPYVAASDMFTPRTITRFTGHANGAVYGAPSKRWDGMTHLKNLFLCGTDQGFVGIIGAMMSGISMANRHILRGGGGK
jgi:phytoene dehydrogenase-like protein